MPIWKRVTEVGDCPMYTAFLQKMEEEREERRLGREREEKYEEGSDEFQVENFFCVRGREVYVLWKYWDNPSWAPIANFARLRFYQIWRLSSKFVEIPEEEEEDYSEEEDDETSEEEEEGSETESDDNE
jgi:hypothetical protein